MYNNKLGVLPVATGPLPQPVSKKTVYLVIGGSVIVIAAALAYYLMRKGK